MKDNIYYHIVTYLEQLAKTCGNKSFLVHVLVHKGDCKCERCLTWWVCLGPLDRDGLWYFGPFTRQEFEDGGGVVAFDTPSELYMYHEALQN